MLNQFDSMKMNVYPVADKINEPNENNISLITPTGEKIQNEIQPIQKVNSFNPYYPKKKTDPGKPLGKRKKEIINNDREHKK